MSFNIDEEHIKIIQILNDNTFDFFEFYNVNILQHHNLRMNFLWNILILTPKYPQIELYLKNSLNYFTVDELEQLCRSGWSILHHVFYHAHRISLNAFEIILDHGINVNIKSAENNTLAHLLINRTCCNHTYNVLNLLIEHGIDLNISNDCRKTVLDVLIHFRVHLGEETKNCIMLLVDFGAKTRCLKRNNLIYDFVEYYKYSSIKPAIKNENKI